MSFKKCRWHIDDYIKKAQYKRSNPMKLNCFLKKATELVKDEVTFSGNTGSSEGHCILDFTRQQENGKGNQCYWFGDRNMSQDTKPLSAVYVYPVDSKTIVNQSNRPFISF
jgi:hypothetical protein